MIIMLLVMFIGRQNRAVRYVVMMIFMLDVY